MIQIYCLTNPITQLPFYVGATKSPLLVRLNQHITYALKNKKWLNCDPIEFKFFPHKAKTALIVLLSNSNLKPGIISLQECSLINVDHYEQFYYDMFKKQGIRIFQEERRFSYHSTTKTKSINSMKLTLYSKNNLNNIWYL